VRVRTLREKGREWEMKEGNKGGMDGNRKRE
jgi:hypothetical protein